MLKSKTTRAAVVLTALAIMTSSLAVGTLAKYAVGDDSADAAHVAKFGVRVDVSATEKIFEDEYKDPTDTEVTVKTINVGENKVAPGTKGSATIVISGQPEVDVDVDVNLTVNEDVWLKQGNYHPVKFTLTQTVADGHDLGVNAKKLKVGTIDEIAAYLKGYSEANNYAEGSYYQANAKLDSEFVLSWEWVFEDGQDVNDTLLGDLAADINDNNLVDGTDYNLDLDFTLEITVEQID